MHEHIAYIAKQIKAADKTPALITAAFMGLELIERAATMLTEMASEESYPAYTTALAEATDAWWALSEAPSLAWRDEQGFRDNAHQQEFAESLATLVMVVAQALLSGASKTTDPADRVACLRAAQHAGRVHAALV